MMSSRRQFLATAAAVLAARRTILAGPLSPPPSVVTVYKDASCQCCIKWVKHLSANGFVVTVHDVSDMDEIKRTMNVPAALQSCHTAVVDRYVVEGHVPADVIKRFIAAKPAAIGLAVPGMPTGAPGMEGDHTDHYSVVSFDRDGTSRVYAKR